MIGSNEEIEEYLKWEDLWKTLFVSEYVHSWWSISRSQEFFKKLNISATFCTVTLSSYAKVIPSLIKWSIWNVWLYFFLIESMEYDEYLNIYMRIIILGCVQRNEKP